MNKKEAKKNIIIYTCMAVASIIIYYVIIPTQIHMNSTAKAEAFNPDTFPKFCTVIFFIASFLGVINTAFQYRKLLSVEDESSSDAKEKEQPKKDILGILMPYIIFLLTLIYGILFKKIGFVLSTVIMIPIYLITVRCKKWSYYVIVYLFAALMYVLFKIILHVPIR